MAKRIQILENLRIVLKQGTITSGKDKGRRPSQVSLIHAGVPGLFRKWNFGPAPTLREIGSGEEDWDIKRMLQADALRLLAQHWGFKISIREWPEDRSR